MSVGPLDHLSASALSAFRDCVAKGYIMYVLKEKSPPSAAMVRGRAVDEAITAFLRAKIEQRDMPVEEAVAVAESRFDFDAPDAIFGEDKPGAMKDSSVKLVEAYIAEIAPKIDPLEVQYRIDIDIMGVPIIGYIDVLEKDDTIRDTKTAKTRWSEHKLANDLQASVYLYANKKPDETEVPSGRFVFDFLIPQKTVKAESVEVSRSAEDFHRLERLTLGIAEAIDTDRIYPNVGEPCGWCPVREKCREVFG